MIVHLQRYSETLELVRSNPYFINKSVLVIIFYTVLNQDNILYFCSSFFYDIK